jgi:hypothetical protein
MVCSYCNHTNHNIRGCNEFKKQNQLNILNFQINSHRFSRPIELDSKCDFEFDKSIIYNIFDNYRVFYNYEHSFKKTYHDIYVMIKNGVIYFSELTLNDIDIHVFEEMYTNKKIKELNEYYKQFDERKHILPKIEFVNEVFDDDYDFIELKKINNQYYCDMKNNIYKIKNNKVVVDEIIGKLNHNQIDLFECQICFEGLTKNDIYKTNCEHSYCLKCVEKLMYTYTFNEYDIEFKCPYCRTNIEKIHCQNTKKIQLYYNKLTFDSKDFVNVVIN